MTVSFNTTNEETELIGKVVDRAVSEGILPNRSAYVMNLTMTLSACVANGCKLDLQGLLDADEFNFRHDIYGIEKHMDTKTGKLQNHFWPRFAISQ